MVTVGAAGQTMTTLPNYNFFVDNLDSSAGSLPTLNFAGSSITGTLTDGYVNMSRANVYGCAGGAG